MINFSEIIIIDFKVHGLKKIWIREKELFWKFNNKIKMSISLSSTGRYNKIKIRLI